MRLLSRDAYLFGVAGCEARRCNLEAGYEPLGCSESMAALTRGSEIILNPGPVPGCWCPLPTARSPQRW